MVTTAPAASAVYSGELMPLLIASARSDAVWFRLVLNATAPCGMMLTLLTVTVLIEPDAPPVRVTVPEAFTSLVCAPLALVIVARRVPVGAASADEGWEPE